jgi:hypothetical protein
MPRDSLPSLCKMVSAVNESEWWPAPGPTATRDLIYELELVLINDEARIEWSLFVQDATGFRSGRPWSGCGCRLRSVMEQGLSVLDSKELKSLALDLETIRTWSELILDKLSDAWWEALLVHGRRFSPTDEPEPAADGED